MNSKPEISVEPILKSLEEEISNTVRGDRLTDTPRWVEASAGRGRGREPIDRRAYRQGERDLDC